MKLGELSGKPQHLLPFDRTYEGLKPLLGLAGQEAAVAFDRTYEGLKLAKTCPACAAVATAFDRTYEGLKQYYHRLPEGVRKPLLTVPMRV